MTGSSVCRVAIGLFFTACLMISTPARGGQLPLRHDGATPGAGSCGPASAAATPESIEGATAGNAADYPFDLVFIDAMLFNHEASVAMAEIARRSSERPEILGLADGIISTLVGDITQLRGWRAAWYPGADPVPDNVVTGLGDEGLMTAGALGGSAETSMADDTATSVQRLCAPAGPFDLAFLTEMIPLHQRAVGMARLAIERADRAELKAFAEEIVAVREAEAGQMITWLAEWYPQGSIDLAQGTQRA